MDTPSQQTATILDIQRLSTEDGPGIRTTVFFKGCSLKCNWCHNPESISAKPQVHWIENRCIGCNSCRDICLNGAHIFAEQGISIDRDKCRYCGACVEECPSTALEMMGQEWELNDLVREVIKDKSYFEKSQGGVTISGGEPTLYPTFAQKFLKALKEKGIQTALDTCGQSSRKSLDMILPYATLLLYDLKLIDAKKHEQLTGSVNHRILENLMYIGDFMRSHIHPKTLWIRTPIIPGATDSEENIRGIGEFLATRMGTVVDRWELCAFNNLCGDKYERLGMAWEYEDAKLISAATMNRLAETARKSGVDPTIVHWSGSTHLEEEAI